MTLVAAEETRDGMAPPSMVERMTLILDAFPSAGARLTLEQVAQTAHLPRSTAHRILEQLVRLQWVSHSAFGYALGARALGLGGQSTGEPELRAAAAGHLHELHVRTGLVVHLAVLDQGDVQYLDKVGGRRAAVVPSRVGGRLPAHRTALGRAMLAWLDAEEVDALLGNALAPDELACFHHELHRVRGRNGLAFERGGMVDDIACVAAAVRSPEGPIGAISLVGDSGVPLVRVAPLVVDAARSVTRQLYPSTPSVRQRAFA